MSGFKNLEDLVADLSDGLLKLRAGELEPEELTPLVEDARELSDRLILLRFKAHEFSYEVRRKAPESGVDRGAADRQPVRPFRIGAAYQTSLIDAIEEVSREQAEQAEKARLDAGTPELFDAPMPEPEALGSLKSMPGEAAEPTAEQTPEPSAVNDAESDAPAEVMEPVEEPTVEPDMVEEVAEPKVSEEPKPGPEVAAPAKPVPAPETKEAPEVEVPLSSEVQAEPGPTETQATTSPDEAPSLAEHMERQPISDLRTAFSLVEKYECIKMLFADDAVEFNRVLEALEEAGNFDLAVHWLGQQVPAFRDWDKEDPVVIRFLDRVERRYY